VQSNAGFFEKNFAKLKSFQHRNYMFSRLVLFLTGALMVLVTIWQSRYFHDRDGISTTYIYVCGLIFLGNGLRKLVLRLIDEKDKSTRLLGEEPHNPLESWWTHIGFRLPLGIHRGLVGVMTLATEYFVVGLLFATLIARGVREQIVWGWVVSLYDLLGWRDLTTPENIWIVLAITLGALVLAWINNAIFLTKLPDAQKALTNFLDEISHVDHPALFIATKVFNQFRGKRARVEEENPEDPEEYLALLLVDMYPERHLIVPHREVLLKEMLSEIRKKENTLGDIRKYLHKRITELSESSKKK